MRQSTAEDLALAGPLAAAGTQVARSVAKGSWGSPRPLAGAVIAAVALTATAQVAPDVAGGIGALMVVVAVYYFPWTKILN